MTETSVLVTGAGGFVGSKVVARLRRDEVTVRSSVRRYEAGIPAATQVVADLASDNLIDWSAALTGIDVIVHCAARVHVVREAASNPLEMFRRVNVEGTVSLAAQAAMAGVKRLVYVSSIGVNGAETRGRAFQADDAPAPHSPYAQSKWEAEIALRDISARTGLESVIVRPPLVYGPDAPGNFGTLMRAVHRGVPLPLGAVDNRRSFVALENLVDLLVRCIEHPAAAGQTFLVSDAEDLSTPDLLRRLAKAMGKTAHLLPVPVILLSGVARLLGRSSAMQSLCASLQADISKTRQVLGWSPVINVDEALALAVRGSAAHGS